MRLILGTTSSARIKILKNLGIEFQTRSPDFDERSHPLSDDPYKYCQDLAVFKNQSLVSAADELCITCDTIVYASGKIMNKPQDYQEAFFMLKTLSGTTHEVITSVCASHKNQTLASCEKNKVTFHTLSDQQIENFLQDPQYVHRAGAYTITGKGALLIKSIEGSYESIVGLPLNAIETLLQTWDTSLWDFIF
jgi:septum formation protein